MPRYFFDLDADTQLPATAGLDDVGIELADAEAARQAALRFLPAYAQDQSCAEPIEHRCFNLQLRDEAGRIFYRVRLVLDGQWEPARDPR